MSRPTLKKWLINNKQTTSQIFNFIFSFNCCNGVIVKNYYLYKLLFKVEKVVFITRVLFGTGLVEAGAFTSTEWGAKKDYCTVTPTF